MIHSVHCVNIYEHLQGRGAVPRRGPVPYSQPGWLPWWSGTSGEETHDALVTGGHRKCGDYWMLWVMSRQQAGCPEEVTLSLRAKGWYAWGKSQGRTFQSWWLWSMKAVSEGWWLFWWRRSPPPIWNWVQRDMFRGCWGFHLIIWVVQLGMAISWWIKRLGSMDWTPIHDFNDPEVNGRPDVSQHPWASWENNYILRGYELGTERNWNSFNKYFLSTCSMAATVSGVRESTAKATESLFSQSLCSDGGDRQEPPNQIHSQYVGGCKCLWAMAVLLHNWKLLAL